MLHPCLPKVRLLPLLGVKAKGRKLPAEPRILVTPTGRQWAQKLRLRSSTLAQEQQRMMMMRNLLPVQRQRKRWSPFPRQWNPWKRTTTGWRNLFVLSKKCKEDDDNDLSISSTEGLRHFQKPSNLLRNHTLNCTCSEFEQVTQSGLEVYSSTGQPVNVWPVLQQGLHVHDQEGKSCFEHDKQWQ